MEAMLARLGVPAKILAVIAGISIVMLGMTFVGEQSRARSNAAYATLTLHKMPSALHFTRVNRLIVAMAYAGYRTIVHDGAGPAARAAAEEENDAYAHARALLDQIEREDPAAKARVMEVRQGIDSIHAELADAIRAGLRNDNANAAQMMTDIDQRVLALVNRSAAQNDVAVKETADRSAALEADGTSAAIGQYVTSIIAILLAMGAGYLVSRVGITQPLDRLRRAMQILAEGDLRAEVPGADRADELGAMARTVAVFRENALKQQETERAKAAADAEQAQIVTALDTSLVALSRGDLTATIAVPVAPAYQSVKANFNQAVAELRTLLGQVLSSASTIRTGSTEIASASEDLARRTEANAASLQQTTAAVTAIDQRLKATAEAAARTVERTHGALESVEHGRSIADDAVLAMNRVADGAKGIDDIIEGLDKIAFQTRVLAMNAAVEAGRAGEAGSGFAVVADLVSQLAMRSEEEASRARDQLSTTQKDIVEAVGMVHRVDEALGGISSATGEVHALVQHIASDNQAQATAIAQIASAVQTMDHSTQQNAAMVEQTSAAARNLSAEVGNLAAQADHFEIGAISAGPARRPAKAAAGYVSPVKPLALAGAAADGDWSNF